MKLKSTKKSRGGLDKELLPILERKSSLEGVGGIPEVQNEAK